MTPVSVEKWFAPAGFEPASPLTRIMDSSPATNRSIQNSTRFWLMANRRSACLRYSEPLNYGAVYYLIRLNGAAAASKNFLVTALRSSNSSQLIQRLYPPV